MYKKTKVQTNKQKIQTYKQTNVQTENLKTNVDKNTQANNF